MGLTHSGVSVGLALPCPALPAPPLVNHLINPKPSALNIFLALQVSLFTRDSTVQRNLRTLVQALSRLVEE